MNRQKARRPPVVDGNTSHRSEQWQEQIDAAQEEATVELDGKELPRIPYGDDYPDGRRTCRDCGVLFGQLHVPGCCVEICPGCKAQALCCRCFPELH